jgi:hypothetical protein
MYLFTGLLIWSVCLLLAYFGPALLIRLYPNADEGRFIADSFVRDLHREFERNTVVSVMAAGVASIAIIILWPLILFILGIACLIALVGGVPYIVIRKMRSRVKEVSERNTNTRGR